MDLEYNYIPTEVTLGNCIIANSDNINCLTEKKADAVMHEIMEACNICDCQLIN
jgi:hypothetical protein